MTTSYRDELRHIRSLLIVTALQKRKDLKAISVIEQFRTRLKWRPLERLMIDQEVWDYAVRERSIPAKLVFCHPDILRNDPRTSVYYRGLCALSLKAAKDYFGDVRRLEQSDGKATLSPDKALKMARTYNTFICSIIKNSTDWTLENGYRTVVATLGITLDGVMRNRVGDIAEERVRSMIVEWLWAKGLIAAPRGSSEEPGSGGRGGTFQLKKDVIMQFGSEPDVSFRRGADVPAVLEIKGGIDPAGALERYGAATKSFQSGVAQSRRCKNFYLGGVFTEELERRIQNDRLVEQTFNIVELLRSKRERARFFKELFHHTLRLV